MSKINQNEIAVHRRYIRINGKLNAKRFVRKTDADRWYMEKKREKELVESGVQQQVQLVALGEYADQWMQVRRSQGKPESSWKTDERRLRIHILPAMAHRPLQRITRREWEEFLNQLLVKHGLNPSTRNRIQTLVSKMYNDAIRQELVLVNPLSVVPKLRESQDKWNYWETLEECSQYLTASHQEGPSFQIFAMIALNTGARVGEILALRHQDMQLERRVLHIWRTYEQETHTVVERTKGKTGRWLGINDTLYEALVKHKRVTPFKKPGDLLVCRENGQDAGKPMEEWMIRLRHRRTCDRAGVKQIRVHDLRHTYASHYVMSGGNASDLQALLGHSSAEMTRKYAHLAPGHLESKSNVVAFSATPQSPGAVVAVSKADTTA